MKNPNKDWTRRAFIQKSSMSGLALALTPYAPVRGNESGMVSNEDQVGTLRISPRYHRWHVDPGVEWLESNTTYDYLDWEITVENTALVLLDVWQRHYLKDTEERTARIIEENLLPLLHTCRQHHMKIVHAPSLSVAKRYDEWYGKNLETPTDQREVWPPSSFRNKSGQYQKYARPFEPREEERQNLPALDIHPDVGPERGDAIIGTGAELHKYCEENGILFLFYTGFNTNACMITWDYSPLAMSRRGYENILVRDCTTGMESSATHESLAQTQNSILFFEMFGQYSVDSREMIKGFEE